MTFKDWEMQAIARTISRARCAEPGTLVCNELMYRHNDNALGHLFRPPEPAGCRCGSPAWWHGAHTGVKGIISRKDNR